MRGENRTEEGSEKNMNRKGEEREGRTMNRKNLHRQISQEMANTLDSKDRKTTKWHKASYPKAWATEKDQR